MEQCLCKCGCGLLTNASCGFYKGHWNKGRKREDLTRRNLENNPMLSAETRKLAGSKPENFKIWNRGLTAETNSIVKNSTEKRQKNIKLISAKISDTKRKKYATGEIVPYWKNKNRKEDESFIEKLRKSTIARLERQGKSVSFNEKSIPFFEKVNEQYGLDGIYGENEFKILGFSVDFYSKKYNLVIEWDEAYHYRYGKLRKKDEVRQEKICKHLSCQFIRIKEWEVESFDYTQITNLIKNYG